MCGGIRTMGETSSIEGLASKVLSFLSLSLYNYFTII